VSRIAPTVLVLALLVATAAAFAVSQRRKLEQIPVAGPRMLPPAFSPSCRCPNPTTEVSFRLHRADTIDVLLVDDDGQVVRTLKRRQPHRPGRVAFRWDGRADAGTIVPEGRYHLRVRLHEDGRTIEMPKKVLVDVTPPLATIVSARPRRLTRGGGRVLVGYRLSERARPELHVNGRRVVRPARRGLSGHLEWWGRLEGRPAPPGRYRLMLVARDKAGNVSPPSPPVFVRIR
jgi:hypothetical protein